MPKLNLRHCKGGRGKVSVSVLLFTYLVPGGGVKPCTSLNASRPITFHRWWRCKGTSGRMTHIGPMLYIQTCQGFFESSEMHQDKWTIPCRCQTNKCQFLSTPYYKFLVNWFWLKRIRLVTEDQYTSRRLRCVVGHSGCIVSQNAKCQCSH